MSELQCYNRGCGKKYLSTENTSESCRHHPGEPVFHDAYKGWSCCNKKCTDFTEFLNIQGCTLSMHSNVKPPEPEKPTATNIPDMEEIVVQPIVKSTVKRPPYDTPMKKMKLEISPSVQQSLSNTPVVNTVADVDGDEIPMGTMCKNGGCSVPYAGAANTTTNCIYHPGSPIFHEGLKFWSCCQKRTSDFDAFLNQIGCTTGTHVWKKKEIDNVVLCRWDFYETPTDVFVSIYAKQYCPKRSEVHVNPIRLQVKVVFPLENDATFSLDCELRGVADVAASKVTMYGTKVEVKLKKAAPGSWGRLDVTHKTPTVKNGTTSDKAETLELENKIESVDLSDL